MIKIIIVEDQNLVRTSFSLLLAGGNQMEVVAEASNGHELLSLIESGVKADLILSDIAMPEMDGIEMLNALRAKGNAIPVVLLSVLDDEQFSSKAFLAGANAYLSKSIELDELLFCIAQVRKGKRYFAAELSIRLLENYHQLFMKPLSNGTAGLNFVERELEVLKLVSEGLTNQEIAERLYLSKRTVEGIRQSLFERTGSKNSAMLIRYALTNGYL